MCFLLSPHFPEKMCSLRGSQTTEPSLKIKKWLVKRKALYADFNADKKRNSPADDLFRGNSPFLRVSFLLLLD